MQHYGETIAAIIMKHSAHMSKGDGILTLNSPSGSTVQHFCF